MKRVSARLVPLFLILALLAGCADGGVSLSPEELGARLLETCTFSETLEPVDADVADVLYGIDDDAISAAYVCLSGGATAEELAVFATPDAVAAGAVQTALEQRVSAMAEAWAGYGPQEVPKLKAAVIRRSGTTVLLVVAAEDPAAAVDAALRGK